MRAPATIAKTPSDVGLQVATCITMLPSSPHVRDVYTKADGILKGLRAKDALLIDSSTIDPQTARDVAKQVTTTNMHDFTLRCSFVTVLCSPPL